MRPLLSLQLEHRLLFDLTDALDVFAEKLGGNGRVLPDSKAFAHVFREFVDRIHYEKEEQVLFPFLVRHGFDWNSQELVEMRSQHCHDRHLIEVLEYGAARRCAHSCTSRRSLAATARALAKVQRRLSMSQDIELFPRVVSSLDPEAKAQLGRELARFDRDTEDRALPLANAIRGLITRHRRP